MESTQLIERRRLNDAIETAFILSATSARDILMYSQTERGTVILQLYEAFYSAFSLLEMLTSDLPQMKSENDLIIKTRGWIEQKINSEDDRVILDRCDSGLKAFREYKRVLSDQGVIALPSR